jgi:GNAT superfamily N-acetyltransferase
MSLVNSVMLEPSGGQAPSERQSRLQEWNETVVGPRNTRLLTLSVRDEHGRLIAGLDGELHWNAFYLATLWVHEDHRGRGYGTALIERAEEEVRAHSCEVVKRPSADPRSRAPIAVRLAPPSSQPARAPSVSSIVCSPGIGQKTRPSTSCWGPGEQVLLS